MLLLKEGNERSQKKRSIAAPNRFPKEAKKNEALLLQHVVLLFRSYRGNKN
jgi:hypothetical protein